MFAKIENRTFFLPSVRFYKVINNVKLLFLPSSVALFYQQFCFLFSIVQSIKSSLMRYLTAECLEFASNDARNMPNILLPKNKVSLVGKQYFLNRQVYKFFFKKCKLKIECNGFAFQINSLGDILKSIILEQLYNLQQLN